MWGVFTTFFYYLSVTSTFFYYLFVALMLLFQTFGAINQATKKQVSGGLKGFHFGILGLTIFAGMIVWLRRGCGIYGFCIGEKTKASGIPVVGRFWYAILFIFSVGLGSVSIAAFLKTDQKPKAFNRATVHLLTGMIAIVLIFLLLAQLVKCHIMGACGDGKNSLKNKVNLLKKKGKKLPLTPSDKNQQQLDKELDELDELLERLKKP